MDHKLKLMVVDDSPLFRTWLIHSLSEDDRFQVVGYAVNALDAQEKIPLLQPDMLTLDIEMPGMSGIDFLKQLLPVHPIPVILVSSLNLRVFDALEAGAVDFVRKPDEANGLSKEIFLSMLRSKLLVAAASHVHLPSVPASPQAAKKRIVSPLTAAGNPFLNRPKTSAAASQETVIAIGASTGGTEAILEVVKNFPENTPGVVITQHMPAGFTAMYAERLNRICKMEVREAKNGDRIRKGLMLLAPGGLQMRVVPLGNSYAVSVQEGEKVNGHRPSVDVLFDSVALHVREHAIGVLLTGMGADGAAGLLRMRKNGAYTIGQDKNSCVVYGMPMEAYKIGAVCQQCPLNTIGQTVLARVSLR